LTGSGLDHVFAGVPAHFYALAIYVMHYNYVRIHQSLRVTPAMAAGVSKTLWTMDDIMRVVEEWEKSRETASSE
jgi:hypothetical protein